MRDGMCWPRPTLVPRIFVSESGSSPGVVFPTPCTPTLEAIVIRVPSSADEPAVRQALRTLIRAELVHVTPKGPRLTLTGFAVAVAMAATPSSAAALPARTSAPLARRRRAA
jgi:hypothetical protein